MTADTALRARNALDRLAKLHPKLIDLGLGRSLALLGKLGNPQHRMPPVIHLAGTNGKGSALAFMRAMLEAGGHAVHAYTSPHLVRFHERIRLAGELIDDAGLADLLEEVEAVNGDEPVTFFEVTTAAAMLAFARHKADYTLLETGLGGRLDSTNVVQTPIATVVTPIAHDHERFLGDTLQAITKEKAGIMRAGIPCFSAAQPSAESTEVLEEEGRRLGAPLLLAGRDFTIEAHGDGIRVAFQKREIDIPRIGLMGRHQGENAGLAAAALMAAAPDLDDTAIAAGAENARWPGRVQRLPEGELATIEGGAAEIWLDGAHNAHGAAALARSIRDIGNGAWVVVAGALETRPPEDFLAPLAPLARHAITLAIPGSDASLDARRMADAAEGVGMKAETATDIRDAVGKAADIARRDGANILISGSLYLAGHALEINGTLPD